MNKSYDNNYQKHRRLGGLDRQVPQPGDRFVSCRACVRAVVVRSPPGRSETRPGDFSSNSHGVLRKSDDKRPTVAGF